MMQSRRTIYIKPISWNKIDFLCVKYKKKSKSSLINYALDKLWGK